MRIALLAGYLARTFSLADLEDFCFSALISKMGSTEIDLTLLLDGF